MIGKTFKAVCSNVLDSLKSKGFARNCYPVSWQVEAGQVITYKDESNTNLVESSVNDLVQYGAYIRDLDKFLISRTGEELGACDDISEYSGQFKVIAYTYDSIDKYKLLDTVLGAILATPRLPNTANYWHQKLEITDMSSDFESIFKAETKQEEMPQGELKLASVSFRITFKFNNCSFEQSNIC